LSNLVGENVTKGNAAGMLCNDLAISTEGDGATYVTDSWGYRLFRIPSVSEGGQPTVVLSGPPLLCTVCNSSKLGFDGPNGIESKDDFLLMGRSGDFSALIKVPISSPSDAFEIPILPSNDLLRGSDGIVFDSSKEILYVTAGKLNQVVALRSAYNSSGENTWTAAEVVATYSTNCSLGGPSAISIVTSTGTHATHLNTFFTKF
jgi:hypothetical protein